ncbi:MAG: glycine/betaine ABC transporter [Ponticaulis sp.]|nr:glycine/betaine ABC transporter [Ponticaulis sp.]
MTDTENQSTDVEISVPQDILEYETDYEIGQDNVEMFGLDMHNPVFILSAGIVLLFSVLTLIFPVASGQVLQDAKSSTLFTFDWLFALTPSVILVFCLGLCLTPLGKIRLGGQDAVPEFKIHSWVAMLFAAGVGVGFMFWGAAEPLAYYTGWSGTPLAVEPTSDEARRLAFSSTLYHWGLAPWGIYAVAGLALGFFAHNKGLPLTIRSAFYPLLGERIWGWPGHVIDLFSVVSTVFGLATTIGYGATQASSGIAYLFGFEPNVWIQIALICSMTGLAVISVFRGMDGGVKLLSDINMGIAFCLMVFVIIAGPTILIFTGFGQHLLHYITDTPALMTWTDRPDITWFHDWTIFYWAWWISWSPFVGMFIARISRGRTIREYFTVVLLAPFTICIIWFSAFGETAVTQFDAGVGDLANGVESSSLVLFQMLNSMPLSLLTSIAAITLLIIFIVTSADSGALVVDTITSGGKTDAPVQQRVFWACSLGLTASALLYGGGENVLAALQAGTITAAFPFTIILLLTCISLTMGLVDEHKKTKAYIAEEQEETL